MKKLFLFLALALTMAAGAQSITDTATLRTRINTDIVTNGTKQITGAMLNRILNGYLNTWPAVNPTLWNQINVPLNRVPYGTGTGIQSSANLTFAGGQLGVTGTVRVQSTGATNTTHWLSNDRLLSDVTTAATGVGSEIYTTPAFMRLSWGVDLSDISGLHQYNRFSMDNTGVDLVSHPYGSGRVTVSGGTGGIIVRDSISVNTTSLLLKSIPYSNNPNFRVLLQDTLFGRGQVYRISLADLATLVGGGGGGGGGTPDTLQNQGTGDTVLTKPGAHLFGFKSFHFINGNGVGWAQTITATDMSYTPSLGDYTANVAVNGNAHNYTLTNAANYTLAPTAVTDIQGFPLLLRGAPSFPSTVTPAALTGNVNDYSIAVSGSPTAVVRLSSTVTVSITGIDIQNTTITQMGRIVILHNVGSFNILLVNSSSASLAANRFLLPADYSLQAGQSVYLSYDNVSARWRIVGTQTSGSTATGTRGFGSDQPNLDIDLSSYSLARRVEINFDQIIPANNSVNMYFRIDQGAGFNTTANYGWQHTDRDGNQDFGVKGATMDDHIELGKALSSSTTQPVHGKITIAYPGTTTQNAEVEFAWSYIDAFGKLQTVRGSGGLFLNGSATRIRIYMASGNVASFDYTIFQNE